MHVWMYSNINIDTYRVDMCNWKTLDHFYLDFCPNGTFHYLGSSLRIICAVVRNLKFLTTWDQHYSNTIQIFIKKNNNNNNDDDDHGLVIRWLNILKQMDWLLRENSMSCGTCVTCVPMSLLRQTLATYCRYRGYSFSRSYAWLLMRPPATTTYVPSRCVVAGTSSGCR